MIPNPARPRAHRSAAPAAEGLVRPFALFLAALALLSAASLTLEPGAGRTPALPADDLYAGL